MDSIYTRINRRVKKIFEKDYSKYKGVILPPGKMRLMGDKFYDDAFYLESSLREGERFITKLPVTKDTEMLEIGCSSGRSVIGLIQKAGPIKRYVGVDANKRNIDWCNKYLGGNYPYCEFVNVDLWHILFNPNGSVKLDENFRYPFNNNAFDIVYLQSVLPNSVDWEIKIFAKEFYRLVKPGGTLFLTDFIEENVPYMTENPENYKMVCTYPRQIVRFEKNYFIKMFTDAGFELKTFIYGTEVDGQSELYFTKP
jgi:SAM-dependent methyltransferase